MQGYIGNMGPMVGSRYFLNLALKEETLISINLFLLNSADYNVKGRNLNIVNVARGTIYNSRFYSSP